MKHKCDIRSGAIVIILIIAGWCLLLDCIDKTAAIQTARVQEVMLEEGRR